MVFITSYQFDPLTYHLHLWACEIFSFAQQKGFSPTHFNDKHSSKATKKNVEKFLLKRNPKFVFLNGHGNENIICGHKNEEILSINSKKLFKNKIFYIVACKCGKKLGPSIVKGNAKAFIGYNKRFCLPIDTTRTCTPLKDNLPKAIKEISNAIPKSILKGRKVKEAVNAAKIQQYKWIDFFQRLAPSEKGETILWILEHNLNALIIEGDENAVI